MKPLKLYLETSVWNFYYADDSPEKKEITRIFFKNIGKGGYEIYISDVVIEEIGRAKAEKRRLLLDMINKFFPTRLIVNPEALELASKYIEEKVMPLNKMDDAVHAAMASVFEMDALISWNLRHLANFRKVEMINGINLKEGYLKRLAFITPMEVADEETG
jgi:predicted nucleic acid-binding protein